LKREAEKKDLIENMELLKNENEEPKRSIAPLESAHSAVIEMPGTLDKEFEEVKRNDR